MHACLNILIKIEIALPFHTQINKLILKAANLLLLLLLLLIIIIIIIRTILIIISNINWPIKQKMRLHFAHPSASQIKVGRVALLSQDLGVAVAPLSGSRPYILKKGPLVLGLRWTRY